MSELMRRMKVENDVSSMSKIAVGDGAPSTGLSR